MLQPKFGYKYLGPYNGPLEKQMLYNKQTGDIYKYYDKPKNVLDKIASRHDVCYELKPKNKGLCDRVMVKEIDNIPFEEKPWGTFAIKQIINTKQKLGMGDFTMKPKYKINDLVRISLRRRKLFDKPTGNIKWSEELFKIHSIDKSNIITYKIKDLNNEIIKGIFYEKELQKTRNTSNEYIIEKILKTNKNKIYVKWRGYNSSFNSWIDRNSLTKYI